ncbi:hypothetical protein GQ600_17126 [Phytophthora cactorum]|nr:hypothetical protein GQ600_17126 [Phytophthora cactorum]
MIRADIGSQAPVPPATWSPTISCPPRPVGRRQSAQTRGPCAPASGSSSPCTRYSRGKGPRCPGAYPGAGEVSRSRSSHWIEGTRWGLRATTQVTKWLWDRPAQLKQICLDPWHDGKYLIRTAEVRDIPNLLCGSAHQATRKTGALKLFDQSIDLRSRGKLLKISRRPATGSLRAQFCSSRGVIDAASALKVSGSSSSLPGEQLK